MVPDYALLLDVWLDAEARVSRLIATLPSGERDELVKEWTSGSVDLRLSDFGRYSFHHLRQRTNGASTMIEEQLSWIPRSTRYAVPTGSTAWRASQAESAAMVDLEHEGPSRGGSGMRISVPQSQNSVVSQEGEPLSSFFLPRRGPAHAVSSWRRGAPATLARGASV